LDLEELELDEAEAALFAALAALADADAEDDDFVDAEDDAGDEECDDECDEEEAAAGSSPANAGPEEGRGRRVE